MEEGYRERGQIFNMITDRHEIDQYAKAIVQGERIFGPEKNEMLDQLASLVPTLLFVHGAKGAALAKKIPFSGEKRLEIYEKYGDETVDRILKRVSKLL